MDSDKEEELFIDSDNSEEVLPKIESFSIEGRV
jgi:hypothetical protein